MIKKFSFDDGRLAVEADFSDHLTRRAGLEPGEIKVDFAKLDPVLDELAAEVTIKIYWQRREPLEC